jgi:UDP-2,3-diacylglucosamine pyrophosphatase LpxH
MPAPRPEIADLLEVGIPPDGKVVTVSDLHLPPARTDVSGRSCEMLTRHLTEVSGPGLTVVLAGDVIELLGSPGSTATDILRPHEDLCAALLDVVARGGQVIYTIGNHDGDLAWDVKAADAVREMTGARLCLAADLILADGRKIRVEHGHQLDPYNCFCDARNPLDTPMGHHIVRELVPRIEFLGSGWVDGAHEMADPADFPSFIGSRLVYRKLGRHLWWLIAIPLVILILVRIPEFAEFRMRYPDTSVWVRRAEIIGYGAIADLVVIAALVAILARRAWVSISALALDKRGYGQNQAARQRAADLVADGYHGFISGHTHHPELAASASGFYANSGSCTSVVEAIGGKFGLPPAYVRNQQICWVEVTGGQAELVSARVELPGATRMERFVAHGRNPHSNIPVRVASWPAGPDWPPPDKKADPRKPAPPGPQALSRPGRSSHGPHGPGTEPGTGLTRSPHGPHAAFRGLSALVGAGFVDREFGGRVGFQALVGDRLAAADGTAVGAVIQPVQRALDGVQPVAQALRDRVVLSFLGERQSGIGVVFRLALHLRHPVVLAGGLGLLEQPAHLVALGDEQATGPVLVHPAVLLGVWDTCASMSW